MNWQAEFEKHGIVVECDPPRDSMVQCILVYGDQAMDFTMHVMEASTPSIALLNLLREVRLVFFEATQQHEKWIYYPHAFTTRAHTLERSRESMHRFDLYRAWGKELQRILGPLWWQWMRALQPQEE